MSIRVAHVITELSAGGAQSALLRLLANMDRERFTPVVACLFNGDGVVAREIRALGIPVTDLHMNRRWRVDALWRLYQWLRRERTPLLHCWMYHANIAGRIVGRLARVPTVITSRRNVYIGGRQRERIKRWTASLDDKVISVCEAARRVELERTKVKDDKVITIYNDIDPNEFQHRNTGEVRQALGIPPDAVLIGAVGRLHRQKGHTYLLAALDLVRAEFPNAHLLIVGDGKLRPQLEARVARLGLSDHVTFAGARTDIAAVLAGLDVLVLASLWEGLPNVILEAMAARLPVVATAVGGVPELLVDNETGVLVPPADAEALASALGWVLADLDRARAMGAAGCRWVEEKFAVGTAARRTEALYDSLLSELK